MKFEYAVFNVIIFTCSTIGSLCIQSRNFPKLKSTIFSILSVAIFFIIWDFVVTGNWWYFNPSFISGVLFGNLPIEEVAFFFVIPWSCLIIWEYIQKRITGVWNVSVLPILFLLFFYTGFLGYYGHKWYLMIISLFSLLALCFDARSNRPVYSLKSYSLFTFVNAILTGIFNGYLTARPVVIYNSLVITNFRIFTIPIEDFLYGQLLLYLIVILYEKSKLYFYK